MAGPRKKTSKSKPAAVPPPLPRPYRPPSRGTAGPLLAIAVKTGIAMAIIFGVVKLVARLGNTAAEQVAPQARYTLPFAEIAVVPPRGLDKITFLSEARHLGDGPLTIQTVDPDLPARLAAIFAKHPWVEAVNGVTVSPDGTVTADLKYRTPVVAVIVFGSDPRTVDSGGILLPSLPPPPADLPKLVTVRPAPQVNAGERWPDDFVKRAADLAATYRPLTIERVDKSWRLIQPDGRKLVLAY